MPRIKERFTMADYNIFILITKKYLQAGYYHNGEITPISIDGNLKITYSSDKDFEKLLDAIRDTFNIDELDDISLSALIISCGTNKQYSDHLYRMIMKTTTHNIINAEIIIPYLCIYKTKLKQDQELCVSLLDSNYLISKQSNGKFKCIYLEDNNEDKSLFELELKDLLPLVELDLSKIGIDEKIIIEKDNRIQQLEKELEQYKDYSAKLASDLEQKEVELQDQLKQTSNFLEENEKRLKSRRKAIFFFMSAFFDNYNYNQLNDEKLISKVDFLCENGELVKENTEIAIVEVIYEYKGNSRRYTKKCTLKAPASGKIIYNNNNPLKQGAGAKHIIIGAICDADDTISKVNEWILSL